MRPDDDELIRHLGELDYQTVCALARNGIVRVSDLRQAKKDGRLAKIRNVGTKRRAEIDALLAH